MPIAFDMNVSEVLGIADVLENLALRDDAAQIDDPLVAVVPGQLQHSRQHRLRSSNPQDVIHRIFSGFRLASTASQACSSASRRVSAQDITKRSFARGSRPF